MKIEQKSLELTASVNWEPVNEEEEDKLLKASSLESLKALYPNLKKGNDDLLKVSFNVAVANLVNSNGHGILGGDADACMESFVHKPFNIEHESSLVIGHATNYGFSTFGDNKIISKITPKYSKELMPFNMSLGGVVYKRADPYYADLLKRSSKKGDYWHNSISASWEILFDEYVIALGSKRLADAEIVKDDAKVKELSAYLNDEGGSGFMKDGTPVYRIVLGNLLPAGVGFTFTPAADVRGIEVEDEIDSKNKKTKSYSSKGETEELEQEEPEVIVISQTREEIKAELKEEILNEISQNKEKVVTTKRRMKIQDITDITEDALKESTASEIRDFIKEQLSVKSTEFKALEDAKAQEVAAKEQEVKAKEAELEEKVLKVSALESKLEEIEKSLQEVTAAKEKMEKQVAFDERMTTLDEKFEITDSQRQVVAKQIRDLSDEDFQAWLGDFGKLVSAKAEGDAPNTNKTLSQASSQEDVPNSQEGEEVNDFAKYKKSFANVKVSV
jgi:hypothetical protein